MLLKRLTEAMGVSGDEQEVRAVLQEELKPLAEEMSTDSLGNLYVKKGIGRKPRIMVAAHMDEIGLMVTGYEKNGLLRITKVGGIDNRVLVSKTVMVGKAKVPGVIGAKAVHLQKPAERQKTPDIEQLYIDIGAVGQEDAEKLVKIGDYAAFNTKTYEAGENCWVGKSFDDRAGCSILAELLRQDFNLELTAVFTVQEEVGLRGAGVAAYTVNPDAALIIEATSASDVIGVKEAGYVTQLGQGPAITFMDSTFIPPQFMLDLIINTAKNLSVPYQFRRMNTAGTDAGKIQHTGAGIPSAVISVPCRYLHSPVSIIHKDDYLNTLRLVAGVLEAIAEGGLFHEGIDQKAQ